MSSALERPPATEEAAFNRRILKQLFAAVAHCHYHFICHRSIHRCAVSAKRTARGPAHCCVPQNIAITTDIFLSCMSDVHVCHLPLHHTCSRSVLIVDGQVQLTNFGSAQVIDSGSKGRLRGVYGRRGYAVRCIILVAAKVNH